MKGKFPLLPRISLNLKRLMFVYHTPFWVENGKIVASHPAIGKYIDSLAPHFSEILLGVPAPGSSDLPYYVMKSTNLRLISLPHYHNIQGFWQNFSIYLKKFYDLASEWDFLNIRMPTHLGYLAYLVALYFRKPVFLVVVGETFAANKMSKYPFFKRLAANLDAHFLDFFMMIMIRKSLTFTNGQDLYRKFFKNNPNVYLMRSSTITEQDIVNIDKKARHQPIRLLTVAVIAANKGFFLIPDVISKLCSMGHDLEWHCIGKVEGNAGKVELERTLLRASELGVSSKLYFHAPLDWDALREQYRQMDLFVLPSYMEGVPRVLLEAQSSGLPVVTTAVGGIPEAIKHGQNGLLVSPGNALELALAIHQLLESDELYSHLVEGGIKTAQEFSLENETEKMVEKAASCFAQEIVKR